MSKKLTKGRQRRSVRPSATLAEAPRQRNCCKVNKNLRQLVPFTPENQLSAAVLGLLVRNIAASEAENRCLCQLHRCKCQEKLLRAPVEPLQVPREAVACASCTAASAKRSCCLRRSNRCKCQENLLLAPVAPLQVPREAVACASQTAASAPRSCCMCQSDRCEQPAQRLQAEGAPAKPYRLLSDDSKKLVEMRECRT
jgi:hypothetical protein